MSLLRRPGMLWLALPATAVLLFTYVAPMFGLARMSFNRNLPGGAMQPDWTLATYAEMAADSFNLELTLNSIQLSFTATTFALLLAYPVSLFLFRTESRFRSLLAIIAIGPLLVNGVVRVFGWIAVLGDRGLVNSALLALGLVSEPVRLIYNWTGVTIGLTESLLPYMVLALLAGAKFSSIFAITQIPLAITEGLLTVLIFNALLRFIPQELKQLKLGAGPKVQT